MKLVIVEDSQLICGLLANRIAMQPRIHVVGTASEEQQAIEVITAQQAEAVILDLALSPGCGLGVLRKIRQIGNSARVLILTNNVTEPLRQACLALGVSGFYDKTHETQQCLEHLYSWLPPLPHNETERLRALHATQLLDSVEQEVFDNITQLARVITGCPIALISLVDAERQWFLSHAGLTERETSRSVSFCAHTILHHEPMIVSDVLDDARFHDNPLVSGQLGIRFYAGVPLVLLSGEALGTLCVVDTQPHELSELQERALKTLAHAVLGEIDLRRRVMELEREVVRREEAEQHIMHLATRDPLTGLPNRNAFYDRLSHHIQLAQRNRAGLAVMFIDFDRFKPINDTLGHDMGDSALLVSADRMTQALRLSDTVSRLGGDEFAVIAPDLSGAEDAHALAEKLIAELSAPFLVRGHRLQLDASIGIALFPQDGETSEQLLSRADLAMYRAKQQGGGRALRYDAQMGVRANLAMILENDLRQALERGEMVIYFQPQGIAGTHQICGLEALVRWNHPTMGLLEPDMFIPLAEERGLILALGSKMLHLALEHLARWDAAGLHIPSVAVNVSALELRPGYACQVLNALASFGIEPGRLELEITESVLMADAPELMQILGDLRAQGVSVAIDDFGVGYSSLGQLRRLPIDALKLDKTFIDEVHHNPQDAAIVQAVVSMARALGLRTIAEGVESAQQLQAVQQIGCDRVQGYYLSQPMPAEAVENWVRAFAE